MGHSIALVTGATSGLGRAAARLFATEGSRLVVVTGRSLAKAQKTADELAVETEATVFTPLELDLDTPASIEFALAELIRQAQRIDLVLLNAGWIGGRERVLTATGIEATQAPLVGHHHLTVGLLRADLLSPDARILIAGSEAARGDVPLFRHTDVMALAASQYRGDRSAAVEDVLRSGPAVQYAPNRAHADAKLLVAWWAAALSRRLPAGMAVYAVSPGSTPDTNGLRNAGPALKWLMLPLVKRIPGMSQTPAASVRRYLAASAFGPGASGQFFASAPGRMTGPIEAMRQPHFHDRANQEATWRAVVTASGIDWPNPALLQPAPATRNGTSG